MATAASKPRSPTTPRRSGRRTAAKWRSVRKLRLNSAIKCSQLRIASDQGVCRAFALTREHERGQKETWQPSGNFTSADTLSNNSPTAVTRSSASQDRFLPILAIGPHLSVLVVNPQLSVGRVRCSRLSCPVWPLAPGSSTVVRNSRVGELSWASFHPFTSFWQSEFIGEPRHSPAETPRQSAVETKFVVVGPKTEPGGTLL